MAEEGKGSEILASSTLREAVAAVVSDALVPSIRARYPQIRNAQIDSTVASVVERATGYELNQLHSIREVEAQLANAG